VCVLCVVYVRVCVQFDTFWNESMHIHAHTKTSVAMIACVCFSCVFLCLRVCVCVFIHINYDVSYVCMQGPVRIGNLAYIQKQNDNYGRYCPSSSIDIWTYACV